MPARTRAGAATRAQPRTRTQTKAHTHTSGQGQPLRKINTSRKRARSQPVVKAPPPTTPMEVAKEEEEEEEVAPRVTKIPSVGTAAGANALLDFMNSVHTRAVSTKSDSDEEDIPRSGDGGTVSPATVIAPELILAAQ